MKGQRGQVCAYLQAGNELTNTKAFELFGATRLGAIVYDLRQLGYKIDTIIKDGKTRCGEPCQYAVYRIGETE